MCPLSITTILVSQTVVTKPRRKHSSPNKSMSKCAFFPPVKFFIYNIQSSTTYLVAPHRVHMHKTVQLLIKIPSRFSLLTQSRHVPQVRQILSAINFAEGVFPAKNISLFAIQRKRTRTVTSMWHTFHVERLSYGLLAILKPSWLKAIKWGISVRHRRY